MRKKSSFESVWARITSHAGKSFHTRTGLAFTYQLKGDLFHPSRTDYQIMKSDFLKAYRIVPIRGPAKIKDVVRGASYVWAVLHDPRVACREW
jgi:hypothetical protein